MTNPIPPAIAYLTLGLLSLGYAATQSPAGLCDLCDSRARTVIDIVRESYVVFETDGYPHRTYELVRKSPRCWGHSGELWDRPLEPDAKVAEWNRKVCWEMGWEYESE